MSGGQEGTGDADAPRPPENASTPVPPKGTAPATCDADSSITPPAGKVVSDDEKKTVVPSCRGAEHAGGASRALNAIIRSSKLIIWSAIVFVFAQLVTDTYLAIFTASARSYGTSSGAYTIGLVMLMIGAALLIAAALASRPRLPPGPPQPPPPPDETRNVDRPWPSSSEAELSLKLRAGGDQPIVAVSGSTS